MSLVSNPKQLGRFWSVSAFYRRVQSELEQTTARIQAEGNAIKATIVQLEEAKATLVAEVSQPNNRSTQLNIRISGMENELQLTNTTTSTLQSRLSIQASHFQTLRQQLADKDQQIAALDDKSAASDAMNQELLKSNAELNAALGTSEVEKGAQAERTCEVVAENTKHLDALLQQNSELLALDTTLKNLEPKLTVSVGRSELRSSQPLVSEERCAKLKEALATLRTELKASRSRCTELEQQLSLAGCEEEYQSWRLLEVLNELNSVTRRADKLRARVQELEVSKQQLDTLSSELQQKLSESECQNRQLKKATAECAKIEQCIEKSAAEKAEIEVRLENEAQVVHALKEKCAEHVAANENLCTVNAAFKSTIEEAKLKMEHLEARIEAMNNENCALRNNLEEKSQRLDSLLAEKQMLQLKLSDATAACGALQKEVCEVRTKLRTSEEQEHILRNANAGLDSFITSCKQMLKVTAFQLGDATRRVGFLQEEVSFFQQLVTRLNLEKECLHSSLATAKTNSQSLEKKCQAACRIEKIKLKFKESQHRKMQLSSLVELLQQECASLKLVLADMSEKLLCREQELASAVSDRDNMASQVKELEDAHARLKHGNQALEDRIDNRGIALKLRNKADKRTWDSCVGHRRRLFMRAESDLLVEMGVKDTASQCTIVQAPCTLQGAWCQTELVSRGTRRLLIYRLQSEMEETTARMQTKGNAMKATIVQLDEAKATLVAEGSQQNNRSTQLNIRISGQENELQLTKTTTATLECRLSIQASHSETLRQQLTDKDQQIAALDEKSAASDAMNQELLKSNAELNAALRTSEVENVAQAERMREVVAENTKHLDALLQQNSKLLAPDTTLRNLESKLTDAVRRSELLSCQLTSKLEEAIATLRIELGISWSRCTELEQQLNQAGCEKESQLSRLLELQYELNSVTRRADQLQARAQELEVSKQQLDKLCSELQHMLSESECQNGKVDKATAECAKLEQCIQKSAAEKAELQVRMENEAQVVHAHKEKYAEHVAANENLCSVNAAFKTTIEEAKLKMEHLEARIKEMKNENCAPRNNLEEKGQRRDTLLAEKQMLQLKLSEASAACGALQKEVSEVRTKLRASAACQAAACTIDEIRLKFKEIQHRQMQLSSLVEQLKQECGSLKLGLADMSEKLLCREQELASAVSDRDNMASQVKELEDAHARLKHDNQALEYRMGKDESFHFVF
ncbi:hypothetical protein HPB49_003270 [Dermacentor silvarum]|uniref:Uncharacterized protein n=1 Tax=Dermacentor silvarum TaxID=543639 RepID=A0ACB8DSZ2_DERSI|nr:hypothetical protein HPB49_003270 [Dermacentor silvarum]